MQAHALSIESTALGTREAFLKLKQQSGSKSCATMGQRQAQAGVLMNGEWHSRRASHGKGGRTPLPFDRTMALLGPNWTRFQVVGRRSEGPCRTLPPPPSGGLIRRQQIPVTFSNVHKG